MSAPRPVLGARVRVRASAGIPGTAGELGTVIAYVTDDSAIVVEIASSGRRIVCEPEDVQAVESPDVGVTHVGEPGVK